MRLSWGQTVAGGLTLAVVAGLLLLPGQLLGHDQPVQLAIPAAQGALPSVQAAPPLVIRHLQPDRPKSSALAVNGPAPRATTYVAQTHPVVRVSPARRLLQTHRSAVISKLAPTAPLVKARVLAAVAVQHHTVKPASSTAKTIAALAASLSKK